MSMESKIVEFMCHFRLEYQQNYLINFNALKPKPVRLYQVVNMNLYSLQHESENSFDVIELKQALKFYSMIVCSMRIMNRLLVVGEWFDLGTEKTLLVSEFCLEMIFCSAIHPMRRFKSGILFIVEHSKCDQCL